jgi:DNA (cytosine-5)-methyltransferase 1
MNVLSVCSGVGGMDRGLEAAGMNVVGLCELDSHARSVLARHWRDVPCHDDLTTLDGSDWHGRVDVVCGGTPCTDLSVAGRRAGLDGEHSRIFWDFCRVADHSAAGWVLWENVAGALSSNDGDDFAAVLWGLTGFRPTVPEDGWRTIGVCVGPRRTAVWRLLDARWFGVAQRRRRVFVVAGARAERVIPVLADAACVPRGARPGGTAGQVVAALTANGVGAGGGPDDNAGQAGHLIGFYPFSGLDCQASTEVFGTLRVGSSIGLPSGPAIAYAMRGRNDGAELELGEPDVYNALRAGDGGSSRQNGVLTPELAVRRLTPRECERLMGWPDDWTRWTADGTEISDSHRYRMCGNGVVSPVAEWIGRRIMEAAA